MALTSSHIAVFDFDGTITTKDSYIEFIIHCFGKFKTYLGFLFLSPVILLYKIRIVSNDFAKEITFTYFFKGMEVFHFLDKCDSFKYKISVILKNEALNKIAFHQSEGHQLVIVSASMEDWIRPWAMENHFVDVIGTQPEIINNKLTGKFATKNCYGIQKVIRLKKKISQLDQKTLHAYGDSKGDKELLKIADFPFYKCF